MKLNLNELLMLLDENDDTEVSVEINELDDISFVDDNSKAKMLSAMKLETQKETNAPRAKKLKFTENQVHQILDSLLESFKTMEEKRVFKNLKLDGFRILHPSEQDKLSLESQSYLLSLEQAGILTPKMREEVMHQITQLDAFEVEPEFLNWLVVNAGINHAEPIASMSWLRDFSAYQSGKIH